MKLAEVNCKKIQFEKGDRVLVRTYERLTPDQVKRLKNTILEWAGVEVEILVYDGKKMEITVEQ